MSEDRVAVLVRTVADDVLVGNAPVDDVLRHGRRRVRRRRRLMVAAVASTAAVVSVGAVVRDTGETTPRPAGVVRVDNPLPLPWWGDGRLHLADVTVPAQTVSDLVAIGDHAAYGTEDGEVVLVQPDGRRATVGHKVAGTPMAGGPDEGWLAWVDPGDKAPQLVLYDVAGGVELGRLDLLYRGERWQRLDGGDYPIAIDHGRVYYAAQDGDWSWAPGTGDARRVSPADVDVIDVRGGLFAAHRWRPDAGWDENIAVSDSTGREVARYRGGGARFSPDVEHLVVWGDSGPQVFPFPSGTPIPLDAPRALSGWEVSLAFGDASTLVVVTGGRERPTPSPSAVDTGPFLRPLYDTWDLSTCSLDTGACTTVEDATTQAPPILAE